MWVCTPSFARISRMVDYARSDSSAISALATPCDGGQRVLPIGGLAHDAKILLRLQHSGTDTNQRMIVDHEHANHIGPGHRAPGTHLAPGALNRHTHGTINSIISDFPFAESNSGQGDREMGVYRESTGKCTYITRDFLRHRHLCLGRRLSPHCIARCMRRKMHTTYSSSASRSGLTQPMTNISTAAHECSPCSLPRQRGRRYAREPAGSPCVEGCKH